MFKLLYKVGKVDIKSRYILCITNALAKKYLNIDILLPKTSEVSTLGEVQYNKCAKFTREGQNEIIANTNISWAMVGG